MLSSVDGNEDLVGGVYCPMDSSGDIHVYCKNIGIEAHIIQICFSNNTFKNAPTPHSYV